jgi:hypothetical protein
VTTLLTSVSASMTRRPGPKPPRLRVQAALLQRFTDRPAR